MLASVVAFSFEGNKMGASPKNFDLRELVGGFLTVVKDRVGQTPSSSSSKRPAEAQLKTAILAAISLEAKNSQEIVTAIALSSGGALTPTQGQVQTSLALLSEEKLVSSKTVADRKVFSITKSGKETLKEAGENPISEDHDSDAGQSRFNWPTMNVLSCDATLLKAASKLAPVMLDLAQTASNEQQKLAAKVLDDARHKLHVILAEN
jgi:DNA-binding PadR family transcriptional regulator